MATTPTTIPTITADGFAQRMGQTPMYPRGWASESAKQPGGVFYALMNTLGIQLSYLITELQYALNAQRIQTETSPELDLASVDFFGEGVLPRPAGMSDANYLALIKAQLLQPADTRSAISNAIKTITGVAPRMIEPWNPADTGCWDTGKNFWDVDTFVNPWNLCAPGDRYQGFIRTIAPPISGLGNNPLLTFDDGAYWDKNLYTDTAEGFISGISQLYALIDRIHVFGTVVWVQVVQTVV